MYRQITKILSTHRVVVLWAIILFIIPEIAQAGFLDDVTCVPTGDCDLGDIAAGFNSLIKMLLGAMGAVALLYFVWGGIQWIVSGGNAEKVNKGKEIMVNTVFAIILAFGSYLIISFFINDVLNANDYRVEEGDFVSCNGAPRGQACGDGRECSGPITDGHYDDLSYKCLYKCQLETMKIQDYYDLAQCSYSVLPGWVEVGDGDLCPSQQFCIISKDNIPGF